jgi:hypothetical protein
MGENALYANTRGNVNTAIGYNAMNNNSVLSHNIGIGAYSLASLSYNSGTPNAGDTTYNVAVGNYSLGFTNPTSNSNGRHNTAIGGSSGLANTVGNNNTFLGYDADICPGCTLSIDNSTAVGANCVLRGRNQLILGGNTVGGATAGYNEVNVGIGLSNDAGTGPLAKLEINADPAQTLYNPATANTGSGLKFRQLGATVNTGSSNYIAPHGKVLTVDNNGVVKLTDDLGYADCASGQALSTDAGLNLLNHRIIYSGNSGYDPSTGQLDAMGLGYDCIDKLRAKLCVHQNSPDYSVDYNTIAALFHNSDQTVCAATSIIKTAVTASCDGGSYAVGCGFHTHITNVGGRFDASNSDDVNIGVLSSASTPGDFNYGGYFEAEEATYNIGVKAVSTWSNPVTNIGGRFEASNAGTDNYGVQGITTGGGSGFSIGVYGTAPLSTCAPGAGNCPGGAAGYFDGDVYATGANCITSDLRLKDNIQPIEDALSVIEALNPKTYTFKTGINKNLHLPNGVQDGVIAQDLLNVLPNLVHTFKVPVIPDSTGAVDSTGLASSYFAVDYNGIIPYLIGGMKQQQSTIDSLRYTDSLLLSKLDQLEQMINNCCNAQGSAGGTHRMSQSVTLEEVTTIVLNQNTPNPFSEETYIDFEIPSYVKKSIIIIYDKIGNVLKSIPVSDRGKGSIHIYAENLSSGTYAYSLVCDGVTIDTKQMVCQK